MPSRAAPWREAASKTSRDPRDLRRNEPWRETASLRGQRSSRPSQATLQAGAENYVGAAQWRSRPGSAATARAPPLARRMPGRSASAPFQDLTVLTASAMNESNLSIAVEGELKAKSLDADHAGKFEVKLCRCGIDLAVCGACGKGWAQVEDVGIDVPGVAEGIGASSMASAPAAPPSEWRDVAAITGRLHAVALDGPAASEYPQAETVVADATLLLAESSNVQCVAEYAPEIFDLLFQKETLYLPRPDYMDHQTDINGRMRAILVDWLVEVHMKYRLRPETLFLTVNILDRYLSLAPVARRYLQLYGVVSMLVAAKFEEITPPEVHDFVYITDNAYTKQEIMDCECRVLTALDFQVVAPTPVNFIDGFQRINHCTGAHRELAQYLVELALLDISMVRHTPSFLAAAALLLSNRLLSRHPVWPAAMARQSRYGEVALAACAEDLRACLEAAPTSTLQAVRKKYALSQHHGVARMTFGAP